MIPKKTLKKNRAYYEQQMKIELPIYLDAFGVLLQNHTPYQATKLSIDYAGPLIKPYVERLITQIDLYPASSFPYDDFARSIDMREAKEFIIALNQITRVDSTNAEQIINDQIQIMNELQEEAYNEQIESRPDEVEKFVMPMIFPLIAIIMTFLFILIADSFSSLL
ncbi:hypothetical protein MKX83_24200 [Cytobacillus sp. FSL M8-0252]|uniref:hypothetical protein n=1 Tax=Cytobacillus sp. FSL M8-0252 TaxID=2921621 RepID=UPI0030F8D47E